MTAQESFDVGSILVGAGIVVGALGLIGLGRALVLVVQNRKRS